MRLVPCLLAGCLALSGCANGNETVYTYQVSPYSSALVMYAGSSGVFPMEIKGQPFPEPVDAETVARAIPLPAWINPAKGTVQWPTATNPTVRTVFVFNPVNDKQSYDNLCSNLGQVEVRPPDGKTEYVMASFCSGQKAASFTLGTGPMGSSVSDPRFTSLMAQVTADLMPLGEPGRGGNCGPSAC